MRLSQQDDDNEYNALEKKQMGIWMVTCCGARTSAVVTNGAPGRCRTAGDSSEQSGISSSEGRDADNVEPLHTEHNDGNESAVTA
jgi:hypothetical protein